MSDCFCQDCGIPSDLGNKCRSCYAKWDRRNWADVPRELAALTRIAVDLNKADPRTRKAVALQGLGKGSADPVRGQAAELLLRVHKAMEGPYGEQLAMKLQAIANAAEVSETKQRTKHSAGGDAE